jgi:SAM-dependent methyltransferase
MIGRRRPSASPVSLRARIKRAAHRAGVLGPLYEARVRALTLLSSDRPAVRDGLPVPPPRLRILVGGTADVDHFIAVGERAHEVIRAAAGYEAGPVLDFGCGCGRVARHWRDGTPLVGVDVNRELVSWCREHLPFRFEVSEPRPPLALEAGFRLVYAISVFTHLTVERQREWLGELHRLLRPGGKAVVSTHGDRLAERSLARPLLERYERGDIVVAYAEAEGQNLCAAYHPAGSLATITDLEEIAHIPEGLEEHDIRVLRKSG